MITLIRSKGRERYSNRYAGRTAGNKTICEQASLDQTGLELGPRASWVQLAGRGGGGGITNVTSTLSSPPSGALLLLS